MTEARRELIADLRWLADQPEGIPYRYLLYRAAYALTHEAEVRTEPEQERHGDATV